MRSADQNMAAYNRTLVWIICSDGYKLLKRLFEDLSNCLLWFSIWQSFVLNIGNASKALKAKVAICHNASLSDSTIRYDLCFSSASSHCTVRKSNRTRDPSRFCHILWFILHSVVFDVFKPCRTQKFLYLNHATLPEFVEISLKNYRNYVGEVKKEFKNVLLEPNWIFLTHKIAL